MTCTVCSANVKRRHYVDRALLKGQSLAAVGRKYGFSPDVIGRHRRHLSLAITQATVDTAAGEPVAVPADYGRALLDDIAELKRDAKRCFTKAEASRDMGKMIRALEA